MTEKHRAPLSSLKAAVRNIRLPAFFMMALLVSGGSLSAADLNPRILVSVGGSFLPDRNVRDSAGQSYPAGFRHKMQAGILAGIDLHAPLALEAGFRTGSSEFFVREGSLVQNGSPINFTIRQFFCNAVYSTPYSDGGLRLFATGGAGLRRIHAASVPGTDLDWSINFGGGLEGRPSRRFSIRVELRDFVGEMPHFVPFQARRGLLHDIQPSVGLAVYLR
jgi:hypothetical protein